MASKSRTETSRAQPRRALAPKMLLLALVGVLAWGVWRVLSPGEGSASKPVPAVLTELPPFRSIRSRPQYQPEHCQRRCHPHRLRHSPLRRRLR